MLFRRLYDDKTLRAMARDCLREEEFMDRNKDLIFEDMEVMTDFELHRFAQMYKVSCDPVPDFAPFLRAPRLIDIPHTALE